MATRSLNYGIQFNEFVWLPAATRGERFVQYIEEMNAKLLVFEDPEDKDGIKKLRLFLANCGMHLRKWYQRYVSDKTKYDDAIKGLKDTLCGSKQYVYLISQLLDLKQKENQAIEDFDMEIEMVSQKIDWKSIKIKEIHDLMCITTLARGTSNVKLREYCLEAKGIPDREKIVEKGMAKQQAILQSKEISNTSCADIKEEPINAISYRRSNGPGPYSERYKLNQQQVSEFKNKGEKSVCRFCNRKEFPHEGGRKNCPAWNIRCNRCSQLGHFANTCNKGKNVRNVYSTDETDEYNYTENDSEIDVKNENVRCISIICNVNGQKNEM